MSTQRVVEVTHPAQAEPRTVAKMDREQLFQLCRAAMLAMEGGVLARWTDQDTDALREALMNGLTAINAAQMARDQMVGLQLSNAVLHATRTRNTGYAGHTVGSFCDALLALAHRDDELSSVEFGLSDTQASRYLVLDRNDLLACEFREMRRA